MTIANENIHISDYNLGKNYSKRDLTMRGFCCRGDLDGHTHEVFEEVKENVVYRVVPASKNSPKGLIFRPSVRLSVTLSVFAHHASFLLLGAFVSASATPTKKTSTNSCVQTLSVGVVVLTL